MQLFVILIVTLFTQWKQNYISIYINFWIQRIFKTEDSSTLSNWDNMDRGNNLSCFFLSYLFILLDFWGKESTINISALYCSTEMWSPLEKVRWLC